MTTHDRSEDRADEILARLPPDVAPPDALRVDTIARLENAGLIVGRRPFGGLVRGLAAAAVLAFAFLAGRMSAGPVVADGAAEGAGPAWALLLYGEGDGALGATEEQLVERYRAWAIETRQAGRLVLAEKLGDGAIVLRRDTIRTEPVAPLGMPSGLFIVRAPDLEAALRLAREMPHHLLGGTVLVRPVEPT